MAPPHEGGAGRPLAARRHVPPRGLGAAHRHRAPARALRDGAVLGGAPPPDGMTTVSEIFETMAYGPAPESDKPALEWIARHAAGQFGLFIGGHWAPGANGAAFHVINPAPTPPPARAPQAGPPHPGGRGGARRRAPGRRGGPSRHARRR